MAKTKSKNWLLVAAATVAAVAGFLLLKKKDGGDGGGKVFGWIAGAVANNLPGVAVSLNGRSTGTNADGYYEFTGVTPGSYQLTLTIAGYDTISNTVAVVEGDNNFSYQMNIHWDSISGTVTDSLTGLPLSNVEVRLGNAVQPAGAITYTDAGGTFSFSPATGFHIPWDMGPYTVVFLLNGYLMETRTLARVPGDKTLTVSMSPLVSENLTYLNATVTLWLPDYAPPGATWRGVTYRLTVKNPHQIDVVKNLRSWWNFNSTGAAYTGFVYSLIVPAGQTITVDITIPLDNLTVMLGYATDIWFVDDDGQATPVVRVS